MCGHRIQYTGTFRPQAAILPDDHRTDKRSRKATAAIPGSPGSLHQSGTKPETPQETWGSGCRPEDVPLPQASRTPVKWIPQCDLMVNRVGRMPADSKNAWQPDGSDVGRP